LRSPKGTFSSRLPPAKEEGITFGKKKGNKREEKVGKRYCLWQYFGFFLFYSPFGGNCFFFLPLFLPEANETEANEPEAIPLWGKVVLFLPLVFFFQRKKIKEKVPFGV
jgi:hypothetical protein